MHMLSATGLVANSLAICGRAVATIVESSVCMMRAQAMISGMSLDLGIAAGAGTRVQAGLASHRRRADHRHKYCRFEEEEDGPGHQGEDQLQDRARRHRPQLLQAARAAAR